MYIPLSFLDRAEVQTGTNKRGIPLLYRALVFSEHLLEESTMTSVKVREKLAVYRESKAKERPSQAVNHQEEDDSERPDPSESAGSETSEMSATSSSKITELEGYEPRPLATALKLGAWFVLWGVSIELGMGVVYVVVSGLLLMVYSLYGSRRRSHEPSAYSVFNKDCENIDGTLTAAQFEKELRYGPTTVRQ